jgi:trk system potassium uptake protein TrkH
MNFRLISKYLSLVCLIIGVSMMLSLPCALPVMAGGDSIEWRGALGLLGAAAVCILFGALLWLAGRKAKGNLFRKEAMAIVGLSWIVASMLVPCPS